jgi:hypothetical protein
VYRMQRELGMDEIGISLSLLQQADLIDQWAICIPCETLLKLSSTRSVPFDINRRKQPDFEHSLISQATHGSDFEMQSA